MALGAGATTKLVMQKPSEAAGEEEVHPVQIERAENVKDVEHYLNRVDEMIARKMRKMEELAWH